jgi:NTE family protein
MVFTPVEHEGHTYSDGGAVNNLPVDVARAMGADIVIAVYLDTGLVDTKTLSSPLSVVGRNISIMVAENEQKNLASADIVLDARIEPALASDYDSSEAIIPSGVSAAEAKASGLNKLALSDSDWASYVAQREARKRTNIPVPRFIDIKGVPAGDQKQIAAQMRQFLGQPIDISKLNRQMADLQSTGLYAGVTYGLQNRDGEVGLVVEPLLKQYGPPFLNVAFTISSNDSNDIQFGLDGRLTFVNIAGAGSELRIDLGIGQFAGITAELYEPIKRGSRFFVAPRAYTTQSSAAVYFGTQQLAQYHEIHRGVGADIGFIFDSRDQLRIGEDYQQYENNQVVGSPLSQQFNFTPAITSIRFDHLGEDNVMVPTTGSIIHISLQHYSQRPTASGGYGQANASAAHFFPVAKKDAVYVDGSGGGTWNASNLGLAGFNLGGP